MLHNTYYWQEELAFIKNVTLINMVNLSGRQKFWKGFAVKQTFQVAYLIHSQDFLNFDDS